MDKKRKVISQEKRREIIERLAAFGSLKKVANIYGLHTTTISKWLRVNPDLKREYNALCEKSFAAAASIICTSTVQIVKLNNNKESSQA